ncbi:efflux RND transporter periplasmic adaptor subunit [Halomonas cupida]|uniref:efflux RND transporter periplasmic adaptor subunit n=1 Tax=Halomonas cupida TaxID=44933 RepID=UPI003EF7FE94
MKFRISPVLVCLSILVLPLSSSLAAAQESLRRNSLANQNEGADPSPRNRAPQRAMVEAVQRATISSELSGRIESIPFREGEAFQEGEAIAVIDCSLYEAELDRVGAKLASARREYDNNQRLLELRSVGQLDVDLSRLAVSEANAEYRAARTNASRCNITAPYSGRVVGREASEGQSVEASEEILDIVGSELEARIIVPATWLKWLEPGVETTLEVEETGERVNGVVNRIGASVDPVSHTIPIWAELDVTPSLRPGMTASATFPARDTDKMYGAVANEQAP